MAGFQGEVDEEVMVGVLVAVATDPGIMIALVREVEAIELVALTGAHLLGHASFATNRVTVQLIAQSGGRLGP